MDCQNSMDLSNIESFSKKNLPRQNSLIINGQEYPITEKDFDYVELLGKGQFSVKKYTHKPTGSEIAVKEFPIPFKRNFFKFNKKELKDKQMAKILNEIEIFNKLSSIDFDHIVQFYGWTCSYDYIRIFMETMNFSLRDLRDLYIMQKNPHTGLGPLTSIIIVSIVEGLLSCRRQKISHGDLKPENVLINERGEVKLSDFGESFLSEGDTNHQKAASIAYWSPEKFNDCFIKTCFKCYEERCNLWSLGIIITELLFGINPMLGLTTMDYSSFQKNMKEKSFIKESLNIFLKGHELILNNLREFMLACLQPFEFRPCYNSLILESTYRKIENHALSNKDCKISAIELINHVKENKTLLPEMYKEVNLNMLKFSEQNMAYQFSEFNFIRKLHKLHEAHRFQHKETQTIISLNSTLCRKLKENLLKYHMGKDHPSIILLYGCCKYNGDFYLCKEAMDICLTGICRILTKIRNNIEDYFLFPESLLGHIVVTVVNVLEYLNDRGYMHGDIRQDSIYFRRDGVIKITNLEKITKCCSIHYGNQTNECKQCDYHVKANNLTIINETHIPPERFYKILSLGFQNDIWAMGTMLTYSYIGVEFDKRTCHPFNDVRNIRLSSLYLRHIYTKMYADSISELKSDNPDELSHDEKLNTAFKYYDEVLELFEAIVKKFNLSDFYEFFKPCLNLEMDERPIAKELKTFSLYKMHAISYTSDRREVAKFIEFILGTLYM